MNERIKLLAEQAGFYNMGIGLIIGIEEYHQKFAQLIVQECMRQVDEQYNPVLDSDEMMKDTYWDGYVHCGIDSVVAIREHFFGVEE
jgi:hypothetical protein